MRLCLLLTIVASVLSRTQAQLGISLGQLKQREHGVSGEVFLLSEKAFEIRKFTYDGAAPDAFFWADTSRIPSSDGVVLSDGTPYSSCGDDPLTTRADGTKTYRVEFPEGKTIRDYLGGSISIWCRTFEANFGEVVIPLLLASLPNPGPALECSKDDVTSTPIVIGDLKERAHDVGGEVVVLSERVLEIRNFTYDGAAPDAFFWADTSKVPTDRGFILLDGQSGINDGSCGKEPLMSQALGKDTFRVEFPPGKTIKDILGGSISVWCRTFAANFGELIIPTTLTGVPATSAGPALDCSSSANEVSLGVLPTVDHQVTGEVVVISDKILEIRGFKFDGAPPDTYFWADSSSDPTANGFILNDISPTTSCGTVPLEAASGSDVYRVEFPAGKSIKDILGGSIAVWCKQFSANFGHVVIPKTLQVDETPDDDLTCRSSGIEITPSGYNCEPLNDDYQVRWRVEGTMMAVELVGRIEDKHYMGFGPSGNTSKTLMDGADPVVVDLFEDEFRARDFYLISRGQCSNGQGVCPDTSMTDLTDDVVNVSGERDEEAGITLVRYKKALKPKDVGKLVGGRTVDVNFVVTPGVKSYVVWAIGPISPDTGYPNFHSIAFPREDVAIEFGRTVVDNCPLLSTTVATPPPIVPFERPVLKDVTDFKAVIGPSGEEKGYSGITGRVSWGIAWYINDLIIPVIELERGTKYTFRVNGGDDPETASQYHPFYITTSISGGYAQLTPKERTEETILAGIKVTEMTDEGVVGYEVEAFGPLCSYQYTDKTEAALLSSYEEYFATLDVSCAEELGSQAGILEFTPDEDTPDTIYYHCVTHRNLGWEIKVVDGVGRVRSFLRRIVGWFRSLFNRDEN